MSQTTTITVTSQTGLELVNGRLWTQYEALIAQVAARLSEQHAFLFARPEKALSTGAAKVAWLAEDLGEASPIAMLPPELQAAALTELERLETDLRILAERMKQEGPVSAEFARLIEDALVRPPGDWAWVVGDRPVLVNWGYRVSTDEDRIPEKPRTLVAEGAAVKLPPPPLPPSAAPPPPPPPPPAVGMRVAGGGGSRWPLVAALWLVFAGLVGLSGYRLLQACSLSSDTWPTFVRAWLPSDCRALPVGPDAELQARLSQAEADVRAREQAILVKAAECPLVCRQDPNQQTRPPVIDPQPDPIRDINKRLDDVKRGKIELDLLWNGGQDLDLSVACPNGAKIDFSSRENCGAQFELDVNANPGSERVPPIEHIIWNDDQAAPAGTYTVYVNYYKPGTGSAVDVPFQLFLNRHYSCDGTDKVQTIASEPQGISKVTEQQKKLKVFTFQMPFPPPPSCRP